jgi:hypothetical protein
VEVDATLCRQAGVAFDHPVLRLDGAVLRRGRCYRRLFALPSLDLTHSPHHRGTAAICAQQTAGVDASPSFQSRKPVGEPPEIGVMGWLNLI